MIIINDESLLRIKCDPVSADEAGNLIEILEKELNRSNLLGNSGIGLAAPQIGIAKHIAIIRMNNVKINLINAKIERGYDQAIFKEEGCLSFPGRLENTLRFQEVFISNNLLEPYSFVATGLIAVACQHELDHLNSTLFMDRAAPKVSTVLKQNKIGPNDKCPCNSGKKYKKCCNK